MRHIIPDDPLIDRFARAFPATGGRILVVDGNKRPFTELLKRFISSRDSFAGHQKLEIEMLRAGPGQGKMSAIRGLYAHFRI